MRNAFTPHNRNKVEDLAGVDKKGTLLRLTRYVLKNYRFSCITVAVCILITSVTTLTSTLFTRTLIDDYIVPLTQVDNPQYASLAQALFTLGMSLFIYLQSHHDKCDAGDDAPFAKRYVLSHAEIACGIF